MTDRFPFPAMDALVLDPSIQQVAWKVYMHLYRSLDFKQPRAVKVEALSETLHTRPASIIAALNDLVESGYLIEDGRGARGVRSLTLAWSLEEKSA